MKEAAGTVLVVLITGSLLGLSGGSPAPKASEDGASGDSLDAQIDLRREGEQLHVCGIYVNRGRRRDDLSYHLSVERAGSGGSATTQQSGSIATTQQIDTLSTVVVNAAPGDRVDVRLQIRQGERVVEEARRAWTIADEP